MTKSYKPRRHESRRTVRKSTLAIALVVGLAFSMLMGIIAGARGLGSIYPQLNLIAKPFVCAGGEMSYSRSVSEVGSATYYSAQWYCADSAGAERKEIDPNYIFVTAGLPYGLAFFALLLAITYLYWNSSIGPAKNGGSDLW